jgi:hypothetical protein
MLLLGVIAVRDGELPIVQECDAGVHRHLRPVPAVRRYRIAVNRGTNRKLQSGHPRNARVSIVL